ncbi:inositol monophosphatase [Candidatus Dojkabacteria bacterium]|nr:inositol monophosphatase [Candidatus Dojkabacteria bacterium]
MYDKELQIALKAAKAAGKFLKQNRTNISISEYKTDKANDYATIQDIKSNTLIIDIIKEAFPDDSILSEESSPRTDTDSNSRIWIIDPIDGTRNFANGLNYFSISIAFFTKGEVKVGVVHAPCYNAELFHAVRGGGASFNGSPLQKINPEQELIDSVVATGFSYFTGEALSKALKTFEKVVEASTEVRFGSAALDLCQVAAGRCGAYYESGLKAWDIAAGQLIVEETGGIVTDYKGNKIDILNKTDGVYKVENVLAGKNQQIYNNLRDILI